MLRTFDLDSTFEYNANNAPIIRNLIQKFPISDIFIAKNNFPTNLLHQYYISHHWHSEISIPQAYHPHAGWYMWYYVTHTLRVHIQWCVINSLLSIHIISMAGSNNKKSVNWKFHFPNSRPRIHRFFVAGDVNKIFIFWKSDGKKVFALILLTILSTGLGNLFSFTEFGNNLPNAFIYHRCKIAYSYYFLLA